METLYTKTFELSGSSDLGSNYSISKILLGENGIQYTFGNSDRGIVFSGIDENQDQVNAYEVYLDKKRLYFNRAIQDSQGNFIILGSYQSVGHSIVPYLIVFSSGFDLISHREINISFIRYIHSLILEKEGIFISLGYIESASSKQDRVACLKLDKTYNVIKAVKVANVYDDQYSGAILYGDSILLYGSVAAGPNKGLITLLTPGLRQSKGFIINSSNIVPRIDHVFVEKRVLLLFGNYIKNNKSYLTILTSSLNSKELIVEQTKVFDLGLADVVISRVIKHQDNYVCIAYDYAAKRNSMLVFDATLNLLKNQILDFENYHLFGLNQYNDYLQIYGNATINKKFTEGLVIQTDGSYESCRAINLDLKENWFEEVVFENINLKLSDLEVQLNDKAFLVNTNLQVKAISRCDDPIPNPNENPYKKVHFNLGENYKLQSPYLSLQTAGSKGIDSSYGNHLRWFLTGNLGDNHLPKGEYASNNKFFNKPDDFVHIYRVPYQLVETDNGINLYNEMPSIMNDAECIWVYKNREKIFYLEFENKQVYTDIKRSLGTVNNIKKSQSLLNSYGNNILKFSCKNELSFAVNILKEEGAILKLETFSVENKSFAEDKPIISTRIKYNTSDTLCRAVAENISFIKFSILPNYLNAITFEFYSDILNKSENQVEFIEKFALLKSEEDTILEIFERLENPNRYTIHDIWFKFDKQQKINIENYKERWKDVDFGLGQGVNEYITLSNTDPKAYFEHNQSDQSHGNDKDESKMEVSYLDFIQLASLDYHNARMLGLGFIDSVLNENEQFIYFAEYATIKNPENYNEELFTQHIYFSLPTGVNDERLPQKLKMLAVTYGLRIDNATDKPLLITDEDGYAFKMNTRYANLKAQLDTDYSLSYSFFNPNHEFQSSEFSSSIFLGFKNKRKLKVVENPPWLKPDLLHEEDYKESSNTFKENALAIFNEDKDTPNYIHAIDQEGYNCYAAYPVNIFYRTGQLSEPICTDETKFQVENTLMPPSNISVHLIQEEGLPMLTTKDEQSWLNNINNDKTLVRLIFDYNHVQEKNYSWGDRIRIFHSKKFPDNIIGGVKNVYDDLNPKFCFIETKDTEYYSVGETLTPKISPDDYPNYIGSVFSYASEQYEIEEILTVNNDGTYPTIKVKKNEERVANLNSSNSHYQLTQGYKGPEVLDNDAFLIVENYSNAISWKDKITLNNNLLKFEVELINSDFTTKKETYLDEDGQNPNEINVRGLWDDCKISHHPTIEYLVDKDRNRIKDEDGNDIVLSEKAEYKIKFNNLVLNHHPQFVPPDNNKNKSSVDWHKGIIRIHQKDDVSGSKARKILKIDEIHNIGTTQKLVLIASDLNYASEVNKIISNDVLTYQQKRTNVAAIQPILKTGNNTSVNYYPSYKAYLRSDTTANFNELNILPETGKGDQRTLLGLQTIDYDEKDISNKPLSSPIGVPVILFGNEIITLEKPKTPAGPLYATPPNFYGKAQYSFKTKFKKTPWGVVFFRTDINRILSAFYTRDTILNDILPHLTPIYKDVNFQDRWQGILKLEVESNGDFKNYKNINGDDFRFPIPNNDNKAYKLDLSLTVGSEEWKENLREIISNCMLPLTEHPIITEFINDGAYIPLPKKQNLRNKNGKILHPDSDEFDMAPMAKKLSDTEILFTDFTLDGNMDINTAYVYSVREMNKGLKFGEPSDFLGPVQLINTTPPEPLTIKNIKVNLPNYENNFEPSVVFEINKIAESQNINKIQIFRLEKSADALNPRGILPVAEIEISNLDTSGFTFYIEDDFSDLDQIPYGSPIYYNIIGVRRIKYVDLLGNNVTEFVPSKSSRTIVTNIIDMNTPRKPALKDPISFNTIPPSGSVPAQISNIEFTWEKCCYKGKYSVFILNEFNNWEQINTIESNDALITSIYPNQLPQFNEDEEKIYYKFKIEVENTVGIRSESDVFSTS